MRYAFNYRGDYVGDVELEYEENKYRTVGSFHLEFRGQQPVTVITIDGTPDLAESRLNGARS